MSEPIKDIISNEIQIIKRVEKTRVFKDLGDIIVCTRALTNQLMVCYATTHREHASKLVVREAAYVDLYFTLNNEQITVQPRTDFDSFGHGLIILDAAVKQAENAMSRGSRGDARSHMMDILAILIGLLHEYGV